MKERDNPESPDKSLKSLTSDHFNIIVAHVKKFHDTLTCPFCGTVAQWSIEPIGMIPVFGLGPSEEGLFVPKSGRLYASLTCRRCFYIYQFAWLPIKREADAETNITESGHVDVSK